MEILSKPLKIPADGDTAGGSYCAGENLQRFLIFYYLKAGKKDE
jgi:hypothetical protein